ncbi:MAG: phosphopentomutase [Solirubrobacterales bacterium]|nr:phosphopentomutase [Solirubrobacterales bacterium]
MSARAIVVTLDACGVGALPDAADYGDEGTATLPHLAEAVGGLNLPTLEALGLGSIVPILGVGTPAPRAIHGRLAPSGPGKDSTTGHWELMGRPAAVAPPTYPRGFPAEVVERLERRTAQRFCCNRPYDGIGAIEDFGAHHLATGELILYTSQDSVLQVAAHPEVLGEPQLHEACLAIREEMAGEHAVGRVIARPFDGEPGAFERTAGRRDFAVPPPAETVLDLLCEAGVEVHGVGKISDLFAGRGISEHHPAPGNPEALATTSALLADLPGGLIFTNLIDTDQVFGHRKDVEGFHAALREIDFAVEGWLAHLREGDLLILTADHGCDPAAEHSDHTREYVPLLAVGPAIEPRRHDGAMADVGATVLRRLTGTSAGDWQPFA